MKDMKGRFLIFFIILLGLLAFVPRHALAQEEPKDYVVKKGEIIDHDYFAAGESITISGIVNGDVYAAGASVTVDGVINGDLLAGAGIITILGTVTDDVRIGAGNVLINGAIGKNLTVGGGNVAITNEAKIGGSILAFAGSLDLRGPIGKDANLYVGKAIIASPIGGDLKGAMENLTLTADAQILGDLEYESEQPAEIDEEAIIIGETTHKLPEKIVPKAKKEMVPSLIFGLSIFKFYTNLFSLIISFLFGIGFLYLFPKRAEAMNKILRKRYWRSMGIGFLAILLFPLLLILLAISIIGIPFIFFIVPFFVFLLYFSRIFTSLCLGKYLLDKRGSKRSLRWALLLGLIVYYLIKLLPLIGPIVVFAFIIAGLGAFLIDQKALRKASK
jgi:hypothetical protein